MKEAFWIWNENKLCSLKTKLFFVKSFVLKDIPKSLTVNVSADSRYILYINKTIVSRGPCKSTDSRWYYETVDIASFLQKGENIIAADVIKYPNDEYANTLFECGSLSYNNTSRGGFVLWSDFDELNTDESWLTKQDTSYTFVHSLYGRYAGDVESVDGGKYPFGWNKPGFNCAGFDNAVVVCPSTPFRESSVLYPRQLEQREIPMLYEKLVFFSKIKRKTPGIEWENLLAGKPVYIKAEETASIELDMGYITTAYVKLILGAGNDADITISYSECYQIHDYENKRFIKGRRDDENSGELLGEKDIYRATVEGYQEYSPFTFRTFRFLRLDIHTKYRPVIIKGIELKETGYPLETSGDFECSDDSFNKLWEISRRTLDRCMHETYEDCPFHEQMQYLMDTCLQMKFTYNISRDDRLARKAILDFHSTRRPDGMLSCSSPANIKQIIPGFSFYFTEMLYDHYYYFKDKAFTENFLGTVFEIIRYFENKIDAKTGLLTDCGYWEFVDWVEEWQENFGVAREKSDKHNYIYTLMYANMLKKAMFLFSEFGYNDIASKACARYDSIKAAANKYIYNQADGLYMTSSSQKSYSQHAQVWAVLSGIADGERAKSIMSAAITDSSMLKCSYCMSFYLFRALEKVGMYSETYKLWDTWTGLLEKNLTTWPEDMVSQRSDCHAWGSIPLYEFPACILGVKPLTPGFEQILIEPKLFVLEKVTGTVPTPVGDVKMSVKVKNRKYEINITLPKKAEAVIRLPDRQENITGKEEVTLFGTIE